MVHETADKQPKLLSFAINRPIIHWCATHCFCMGYHSNTLNKYMRLVPYCFLFHVQNLGHFWYKKRITCVLAVEGPGHPEVFVALRRDQLELFDPQFDTIL